jgi:transposase
MVKARRNHRSFTREFKLEAVRRMQARPEGVSVAHIGRELGVRAGMLRDWAQQVADRAGAPPTDVFPGHGRLPADEEELRQLRRENARLQQENEFLKKAAAYFAQEHR